MYVGDQSNLALRLHKQEHDHQDPKLFITTGGLLAALGVAAGAIGAHLLEDKLAAERMESYQTAVRYQTIHAVGLVLVGLRRVAANYGRVKNARWGRA